jgi:hypothetical protein
MNTLADGPSQRFTSPAKLVARAVDWDGGGAIHGFGVVDDLARNYGPHETLLLSLTGAPPTSEQGRAFGVALTWICAADIGSAPTHAGVLAQISGAPVTNLLAIAVLAAGQEAEHLLAGRSPTVDHESACTRESNAGTLTGAWRRELQSSSGLDLPELELVNDAAEAALAVFRTVGLEGRAQIVSAWVWGRMIGVVAEALAYAPLEMRSYPLRVPAFEYEEERVP